MAGKGDRKDMDREDMEEQNPGEEASAVEQKLSLEEAFGRLDQILAQLGDKEVSLDTSFAAYYLDQVEKDMLVLNKEGGLDEF